MYGAPPQRLLHSFLFLLLLRNPRLLSRNLLIILCKCQAIKFICLQKRSSLTCLGIKSENPERQGKKQQNNETPLAFVVCLPVFIPLMYKCCIPFNIPWDYIWRLPKIRIGKMNISTETKKTKRLNLLPTTFRFNVDIVIYEL